VVYRGTKGTVVCSTSAPCLEQGVQRVTPGWCGWRLGVRARHVCGLTNHLLPQKHLAGLGLTEAIDKNKADLSRMSGKKDLYLASVFHATAFEWDTEGNPFDQDIYGREELRSPKLFYADHPFIFLVRDNQSGSLLFIGRLVRPKGDKMRDEL
jgi:hypothetical protein